MQKSLLTALVLGMIMVSGTAGGATKTNEHSINSEINFNSQMSLSSEMLSSSEGIFRKKKKKEKEPEKTLSEYEKKTQGAEKSSGMFDVFKKDGEYYFDIPTKFLGRDMLVVNKLTRVPSELNEAGVNRGVNYQNQMVRMEWDKQAKKIFIRQERPLPYSSEDDAISTSVKDNFISPIIAGLDIEATNADSTSLLVKVTDFYDGSKSNLNNVFSNINLGTSPIGKLCRILSIKAFHNNVEAISELTTRVIEGMDDVYVTVEVSSSLMLLPQKPMMGRYDNPKVGYFTNDMLAFSDKQQQVDKKSYITRWRLEPKDEDKQAYLNGELVEPKKPIQFYIDSSTPLCWRKYIKKGIEDWNIAFNKAGFKNAISAEILTDSLAANMDDINYSVLTYAASEKANAMGPSLLDPRTGEILEADIMWWHNVLSMVKEWLIVQTGAICPDVRSADVPDALMGDAIRFIACHEVGHSLGLRHNMMGSWAFPTDSLRSESFTSKMGATASSIMDYARFNYVAQPGDGVKVLSPHIGPYDIFAIEYGYRWYDAKNPEEEKPILAKYLKNHNSRLYKYLEAQDSRDAVDPRAQTEDLGDDAMKSSRLGIANLKRIVPNIIEWTTTGEEGQSYKKAANLYSGVICQWNNYMYHVLANIGGIYIENTTVGDGVKTYTFVEKEKQKEAFKFLAEEILTYPEWLFGAEISKYTFILRNSPLGTKENAPMMMLRNAQAYILWDMLNNDRLMRMTENEMVNGKKAYTPAEFINDLHNHIFGVTEKGGKPNVMQRSLQKNFLDALMTAGASSEAVRMKSLSGVQNYGAGFDVDGSAIRNDIASDIRFMELFRKSFGEEYITEQLSIREKNRQAKMNNTPNTGSYNQDRMSGRRQLNFYGSQLRRISDGMSAKRGELLRIRKLLKRRVNSSDAMTRYHYEDMILRINTALGI